MAGSAAREREVLWEEKGTSRRQLNQPLGGERKMMSKRKNYQQKGSRRGKRKDKKK